MSKQPSPSPLADWGCLAVFTIVLSQFSKMLFAWPVGAILGAGQWVQVHTAKKPSWQFQFVPELQWIEILVLVGTGLTFLHSFLEQSRLQKRYEHPQNPRCRNLPSVKRWPELGAALEQSPEELLVEYESPRERALEKSRQSLFSGLLTWVVSLQVGNLVTQMVPLPPFSPPRFLLLAICLLLPLARLRSGLQAIRISKGLDERLLLDFSRQEIANINCNGDSQTPPARLLNFSEIQQVELRASKAPSGQAIRAALFLTSQHNPPLQIGLIEHLPSQEAGRFEQAAQKLADALGKPLSATEMK